MNQELCHVADVGGTSHCCWHCSCLIVRLTCSCSPRAFYVFDMRPSASTACHSASGALSRSSLCWTTKQYMTGPHDVPSRFGCCTSREVFTPPGPRIARTPPRVSSGSSHHSSSTQPMSMPIPETIGSMWVPWLRSGIAVGSTFTGTLHPEVRGHILTYGTAPGPSGGRGEMATASSSPGYPPGRRYIRCCPFSFLLSAGGRGAAGVTFQLLDGKARG